MEDQVDPCINNSQQLLFAPFRSFLKPDNAGAISASNNWYHLLRKYFFLIRSEEHLKTILLCQFVWGLYARPLSSSAWRSTAPFGERNIEICWVCRLRRHERAIQTTKETNIFRFTMSASLILNPIHKYNWKYHLKYFIFMQPFGELLGVIS